MNPYEPTEAPVELKHKRDPALDQLRPRGIVVVAVLFVVFSGIDTLLMFLEGGVWWIVTLAVSVILVLLFRGLWHGDEPLRRVGVYLGLFLGFLSILSSAETITDTWSAVGATGMAEGIFLFATGVYLRMLTGHPFFTGDD